MDNTKETDADEADSKDESTDIDNSDEGYNPKDKEDIHITDEEEWVRLENLQTDDTLKVQKSVEKSCMACPYISEEKIVKIDSKEDWKLKRTFNCVTM